MSYAAEPYSVFADDLLSNLTGGVTRLRFRFIEDERPFRLGIDEPIQSDTVRVHGLVDGDFHRFSAETDYVLDEDRSILWLHDATDLEIPAATATWPDSGSEFWVSYDRIPGVGAAPVLTDRNPGSITRTLAEALALEFAVTSHQLDGIYRAAHLETAENRDLDHVVALVGVDRRGQTHARGEVAFRRPTPAPGEITIPAGTLVSTSEPPVITVETTETVTLRRGDLSVAAPVRAREEGPGGIAPVASLSVIHRPILGVEEAINPTPMTFGGASESDSELRGRAKRALARSGRSTVEAIQSALASLEGVREQDILVEEDHLAFPGIVKVKIAAELTEEVALAASLLIEEYRPAGVRVVHDLPAPIVPEPAVGSEPGGGGEGPIPEGPIVEDIWFPVAATVTVTPSSTDLTDAQRQQLAFDVESAFRSVLDLTGIAEPIIYNRLVSAVFAVQGVYDVIIDIGPNDESVPGRTNIRVPERTRPQLAEDALTITLRGALVALDVTAEVELFDLAATADSAGTIASVSTEIADRLSVAFQVAPDIITPPVLLGLLPETSDYRVESISYKAEFLEEGLRVELDDVTIDLTTDQQPWIRGVTAVPEQVQTS
jgi:uncharacterized phage protein gp47/JayE